MTIMANPNVTTICWVLSPLKHWLGWEAALFLFSSFYSKNDGWFLRNEKTTVPSITQLRLKTLEAEAVRMDLTILTEAVSYIFVVTYLNWHDLKLFLALQSSGHLQCIAFSFAFRNCRCSCNRYELSGGLGPPSISRFVSAPDQGSKHCAIHHPVWPYFAFLPPMVRTRVGLLGGLVLSLPDC